MTHDQRTTPQEEVHGAQDEDPNDIAADTPAPNTSRDAGSAPVPSAPEAAAWPSPSIPPAPASAAAALPEPAALPPGNLAELSARVRLEAAEITEIAAQAGRLGITIDAAKALREGTAPEALRKLVLERASAAADTRDIVAAPPSPVIPEASESPIVTAAKRAAASGSRA